MQYHQAYGYLMPKLEKSLAAHLTYHNAEHTKDVIRVARQLAKSERILEHDEEILLTAALFHDAGFLEGYDNHEELSCKIARETLPQFGYRDEDIEEICRLIMATRITQKPTNALERILCDADLAYLGTDDYFPRAEALFLELQHEGKLNTWEEWQKLQLSFIEEHRYYSPSAIRLFTGKKSHNFLLFKSGVRKTENLESKRMSFLKDLALLTLGVLAAAFGLKCFLLPYGFFDGGVTGIAMILYRAFGFNLSLTTFILNLPFIIAGYFVVSHSFSLKAFIGVSLLAVALLLMPQKSIFPEKKNNTEQTANSHNDAEGQHKEMDGEVEKMLIAFFGGFFLGVGSGLALRAAGALDGTEVLALYTQRLSNFTIAEIILAINIVIFSVAAIVAGPASAFYSVFTYIVASKTIIYVVEGFEAYTGVTIVSAQSEVLKSRLVNELRRSITVYKGERGYLPGSFGNTTDCDIIFTVISRLELRKLKIMVYESDPDAFIFANTINEASGGIMKNKRMH